METAHTTHNTKTIKSHLHTIIDNISFTNSWKSEQPEYSIRHSLQYIAPDIQNDWIDFVKLVKVTEDNGILW